MVANTLNKISTTYRQLFGTFGMRSLFPRLINRFSFKLTFFVFILLMFVAASVVGLRYFGADEVAKVSAEDSRIEVAAPKKIQEIGREVSIPVEGDLAPVRFVVEKAELRDELIIKGQRANSVQGRTFLVVTLKLVNDNTSGLSLNTRNFMRLSVNGRDEEWLAPDIHNDPVEVQAISTKYTRLGFPVSDTDTDLKLRIGVIDGDKRVIELNDL